jgi:hypothetical protein
MERIKIRKRINKMTEQAEPVPCSKHGKNIVPKHCKACYLFLVAEQVEELIRYGEHVLKLFKQRGCPLRKRSNS